MKKRKDYGQEFFFFLRIHDPTLFNTKMKTEIIKACNAY